MLATRLVHVHVKGDAGLLVLNRIEVAVVRISLADLISDAKVRVLVNAMVHFDRGGSRTLCIIHDINLSLTDLYRSLTVLTRTTWFFIRD